MANEETNALLDDERVQSLIARGAHEGRLTYGQINSQLGDLLLDEDGAEAVISALEDRGVDVVSDKSEGHGTGESTESDPGAPQTKTPKTRPSRHSDLDEALSSLEDLLQGMELPGEGPVKGSSLFEDEDNEELGIEDSLRQYLNRMGQIPRLSSAEEADLARQAREGSEYAREDALRRLAEANLRLVVAIARSYGPKSTLPMIDLIQEGNLGLMRAAKHFRPEKGEKFGSFATWYIRESIRKAVNAQARLVKLPTHLAGVLRKLQRLQTTLTQDLGRAPGHDELAVAAGLTLAQVEDALRAGVQPLSLEAPRGDDEDPVELGDLIAGDGIDAERSVSRQQLRGELARALEGLGEREKAIIQMRFGIGVYAPDGVRSMEDIAREMKISRERVHELEVKALRKLRRRSRAGALHAFLENPDADDDE